jgi:hypothetical protein
VWASCTVHDCITYPASLAGSSHVPFLSLCYAWRETTFQAVACISQLVYAVGVVSGLFVTLSLSHLGVSCKCWLMDYTSLGYILLRKIILIFSLTSFVDWPRYYMWKQLFQNQNHLAPPSYASNVFPPIHNKCCDFSLN